MLNDIYTVWLREMTRFGRARSRVVSSLAMPLFWLIFLGTGFGSAFSLPGMDYTAFLAPGIIGMIVLFTSIFSGVSVIWDRQFGFLKEILVAPVSRVSVVIGKALGGATVATFSGLIMLAIAYAIGAIQPSYGILPAMAFMFLTGTCFVAAGLAIAARMRSMEGFQMIMSFIVMPTFFLSGALFPLSTAPDWMRAISNIDPLTYGVDGLRHALAGNGMLPIWLDFTILAVLALVAISLASYLFRRGAL
ncbi:MAG: ABC transporter permease [Candidatus Aenigmarchaeota archaeon]|nr:ABC transporter permease [Candidatus Aenigmarchaeota archaeon]